MNQTQDQQQDPPSTPSSRGKRKAGDDQPGQTSDAEDSDLSELGTPPPRPSMHNQQSTETDKAPKKTKQKPSNAATSGWFPVTRTFLSLAHID